MADKKIYIAPSLLASDLAALGYEARRAMDAGADWLHYDVMDGNFVPKLTYGADVLTAVKRAAPLPMDAHLMMERPELHIDTFIDAGADIVSVHAEATDHLQRLLAHIRARGARSGVALNPATPINCLEYVLDDMDLVLIMTVNPGLGGQKLIPATMEKVRQVRRMLDEAGSPALLEVDGGLDEHNAAAIIDAGADVLVAGSAVFRAPDMAAAIAALRGGRG